MGPSFRWWPSKPLGIACSVSACNCLAWPAASYCKAAAYRWALRGTRYATGCWPTAVHGTAKVEAVTFQAGKRTWTEPCDMLACGFGLVPNLELPLLLGCEVRNGAVVVDDWQESTVPGVYCAGELTGIGGAELAAVEGEIAGFAAIGRKDCSRFIGWANRSRGTRFAKALEPRHLPCATSCGICPTTIH